MRTLRELVDHFIDTGVSLNDMTAVLRCVGHSEADIGAVYDEVLPTVTYRTQGGIFYIERD